MTDLDVPDFFTPANYTDGFPHEIFTRRRAEDPVHWSPEAWTPEYPLVKEPGPGYWAITRHADVNTVLRTPAVFSSHLGGTMAINLNPATLRLQQRQMLNMDPPEHSRLRHIINRAFTPKAVEQLRASIEQHTAEILDEASAAARSTSSRPSPPNCRCGCCPGSWAPRSRTASCCSTGPSASRWCAAAPTSWLRSTR